MTEIKNNNTNSNYWLSYEERKFDFPNTISPMTTMDNFAIMIPQRGNNIYLEHRIQSNAEKYPSDMKDHGYIVPLARHLPNQCRSMLEIGIAKGFSGKIWEGVYGHNELDLHYLDLFENPEFLSVRECRNNGWVPHNGSQSDMGVLSAIKDKFEVILDDGSHVANHMIVSFKHLFVNNLISGGIYCIMDCHCNKEKFYWGEGVEKFEDTPLWMFKNYLETGRLENFSIRKEEAQVFENLIEYVSIEADEKLIFIKKKK